MKKLPKQLKSNIKYAQKNYCFIKCDESSYDGYEFEFDTGYCNFTGLWTNKRVELVFDDESMNLLVDYNLAYALVNHDDFGGELDRALSA